MSRKAYMAPEHALQHLSGRSLDGHPWRRYAMLGDSVVEQPGGFAEILRDELAVSRPDLASVNLGRRNLRAAEVHATQRAPALAFEADLALVVCGAHDAMRPGSEARADAAHASLAAAIRPLHH